MNIDLLAQAADMHDTFSEFFGKQNYSFYIETFGCQQNVSDSEYISGALEAVGFTNVGYKTKADVVILNSCAVRETAETRFYGKLGELKPLKITDKNKIIILCGCMFAEQRNVALVKETYRYVDIVADSTFPERVIDTLYEFCTENRARIYPESDEVEKEIVEGLPVSRASSYEVSVPIMYGCDNHCTYCIVPYVRGSEVSRKSQDIVADVTALVEQGAKQVMLLGQNVNSYGKSLDSGEDFLSLLKAVCDIPGEFRVDFLSSHPRFFSIELLDFIGQNPKMSKFIHLPLQSGCDRILKAMGRGYTVEDYRALVNHARKHYPDINFSSDIIVGFPGETREDFEQTLEFVREVGFTQLFTFLYSKRPGTPAADYPDNEPRAKKTDRLNLLISVQKMLSETVLAKLVGSDLKVLITGAKGEEYSGKVGSLLNVNFVSRHKKLHVGQMCDVTISASSATALKGTYKE